MLKKTISLFEKHNKLSWAITILIAITIFYISSITFEFSEVQTLNIKSYLYHFFAFFFLCFFLLISMIKGNENKKLIILGIILAILYGISDEIHQFFVSGRACCLEDVLTNSMGILLAGGFYLFRLRKNNSLQLENLSQNNAK